MKGYRVITLGLPRLLDDVVSSIVDAEDDMELTKLSINLAEHPTNTTVEALDCDVVITQLQNNSDSIKFIEDVLYANPRAILINLSDDIQNGQVIRMELKILPTKKLTSGSLVKMIRDGTTREVVHPNFSM